MTEGKRDGLEDSPFSYRATGDGKVFISWRGQQVMILKGDKAATFLARIEGLDDAGQQMAMVKITGNFKRGNERAT